MVATSAVGLRRIAFVTGAAQGIGRAVAIRLARDGLNVAVADLPSKRKELNEVVSEITESIQERHAVSVEGDVSNEAEMKQMMESVVEHLGGLDVVRPMHLMPDGNTDLFTADGCERRGQPLGETR